MKYELKDNNMSLKIEHPNTEPAFLPWDLRTIIECQFTIEDINTLEAESVLQVGECYLSLVKVIN